MTDLSTRAHTLFVDHFNGLPAATASAPGRVNLIGDHTDYAEGFVLPAALALGCVGAIAHGDGARHEFIAADRRPVSYPVGGNAESLTGDERWARYVVGVIHEWHAHHQRPLDRGYRVAVASDVPLGAGLSSSAALEVAIATALDGLHGCVTAPVERALLCQRAEHRYAGVPCGIMDQLIACTGRADHAMLIDCRSLVVDPVRLPMADDAELVLVDTGVRHRNDDGAYAARREACRRAAMILGVVALRDADAAMVDSPALCDDAGARAAALHVVGENSRVLSFADAMRAGDVVSAGGLMNESHDSLSRIYRVSCPEADALVQRLQCEAGVLGARMTGAGFGGWVVALVRPDVAARMVEGGAMRLRAADGARVC